ncbi:MAG TPA: DUF1080 domain-containing protein [Ohtaekwangia sp.]|nr:DUF1080 domain-containing protein [Ohtaekwangia sp.]
MKKFITLVVLLNMCTQLVGQRHFPEEANDETGFVSIFDGKTLKGWEGDPVYWRVEEGNLVGEITPETIVRQNTFIIWRGGVTRDFELKTEVRISMGGNSGINYRSAAVAGQRYALKGYQADIDGANEWSGQNYEERGREFLALRGQICRVDDTGNAVRIGTTGDKTALAGYIKSGDWNTYHLIVKGDVMIHMINGQVMSVVIDNDEKNKTTSGLLGVQVHVGPPMKVEYRNIRLKDLSGK